MKFKQRIGPHPHANPSDPMTAGKRGCPDIWELDTGDFAVIGVDVTDRLLEQLPSDASCGSDEKIVLINRHILVNAKPAIPQK